jgi:hypothetical protein
MCPAIDNRASCSIRTVVHFLRAVNINVMEIHLELCAAVYGQNVKNKGTVRQWCTMFKDERKNEQIFTMKSEVVGHQQLVMIFFQSEKRRFTISELLYEFPQVLRTFLYEIITVRLGYHKFCTRWFSENIH